MIIWYDTNMTSNTTPAPLSVTASSYYSPTNLAPWKAFNGTVADELDRWRSVSGGSQYLQLDFGENKTTNILAFTATSYETTVNATPVEFRISGSWDGYGFFLIKNFTSDDFSAGETKYFDFPDTTCRVYRITFTRGQQELGYYNVGDLKLGLDLTSKSLIFNNSSYKKWDETNGWSSVSDTLPSMEIFNNEGMDSLTPLLDRVGGYSPLDELTGAIEVLTWGFSSSNRKLSVDTSPNNQVVYPKSDISLSGVDKVGSISVVSDTTAKIAVSFDQGSTWKAFRNGAWQTVVDALDGMLAVELNALTPEQIKDGLGDSETIRFSYGLYENSYVDKITLSVDMEGTERILPSEYYDLEYELETKTIVYNLKKNMTLSVNYIDSKEEDASN